MASHRFCLASFLIVPFDLSLRVCVLQDEISSTNPASLQLLEQHGGGMVAAARNAAAPAAAAAPPAAGKGGKEPSPRTNPIVNRREWSSTHVAYSP